MTTVNATWFKTLIQDTTIADATAVIVIQHAIDRLNTYGAGISDLTAGALTATSAQAGAIGEAARLVYWAYYKGQLTAGALGLNVSTPNMLTDSTVEAKIANLANQFKTRTILKT